MQGKPLSNLDWKFFFFSWWKNPQCAIDPVEPIPQRLSDYFSEIEAKYGIALPAWSAQGYHQKGGSISVSVSKGRGNYPVAECQNTTR